MPSGPAPERSDMRRRELAPSVAGRSSSAGQLGSAQGVLMSQLWAACGGNGLLQLTVAGRAGMPGTGCLSLPQPFAVIGRAPEADLVLDHPDVSQRHAYLQV